MFRKMFVFAALSCLSALAFAQEGHDPMKAMMEAGALGPQHEMMAKYVGEWDCAVKIWMDPTQPPMESKGSEVCKIEMGGRVCACDFTGDMMGSTFHGQSQMGFSNFAKQYWATWTDDMSTGMMYAEGTASEDGKTITLLGSYDDPMSGTMDKPWKQVMTMVNDDKHVFSAYENVGTPEEYKTMEITYTRKK